MFVSAKNSELSTQVLTFKSKSGMWMNVKVNIQGGECGKNKERRRRRRRRECRCVCKKEEGGEGGCLDLGGVSE